MDYHSAQNVHTHVLRKSNKSSDDAALIEMIAAIRITKEQSRIVQPAADVMSEIAFEDPD
ncbi:hypothetical protein PHLCEN_2v2856 [Hermanssonia centrifuga]|uniref:Uncharacterized protein n=1 Tax=Hermanssonia centrifuga TaxID=98765 RepID=A0A2R6RI84_9APHY|nr:hypothetical protein PHLCEN_2v2856 [Hermanssonia centrifuga]